MSHNLPSSNWEDQNSENIKKRLKYCVELFAKLLQDSVVAAIFQSLSELLSFSSKFQIQFEQLNWEITSSLMKTLILTTVLKAPGCVSSMLCNSTLPFVINPILKTCWSVECDPMCTDNYLKNRSVQWKLSFHIISLLKLLEWQCNNSEIAISK